MAIDTDSWALANLPYFRALAFFGDLAGRSDQDVLAAIHQRHAAAFQQPWINAGKTPPTPPPWRIEGEPPLADLDLLKYDTSRVWWQVTEAVYPPFESAYRDAILRWAAISRGVFPAQRVEESWAGTEDEPENPVVRIRLPDGTLTLTPQVDGDWFDLTTLVPINHYLRGTDIHFALYEQFDQTAFIAALTAQERENLEKMRGWVFHQFPESLRPSW